MKRAFDGKPAVRDASRRKNEGNASKGEPKPRSSVEPALDGLSGKAPIYGPNAKTSGSGDGAKGAEEKKDEHVLLNALKPSVIIFPPKARTDVSPQDEKIIFVKERVIAYGDPVLVRSSDNKIISQQPIRQYVHLGYLTKNKD